MFAKVLEGLGTGKPQNNIYQRLSSLRYLGCIFPILFFVSSFPPFPGSPAFFLIFCFTSSLEEVILLRCPTHLSQAQPFSKALRWDSSFAAGSAK